MGLRSDFTYLRFNEHLGDKAGDLKMTEVPTTWVGGQTSLKNFTAEGPVLPGYAYLMVTAYDVQSYGHRVVINGLDLNGFDIPPCPGRWQTWMDLIDTAFIAPGNNTFQIIKKTGSTDNFIIGTVVIHWRELG